MISTTDAPLEIEKMINSRNKAGNVQHKIHESHH